MNGLVNYSVRPYDAQRYFEEGASADELARFRRWGAATCGRDPIMEGNDVQTVHGRLWSTVRFTWGGAGTVVTPGNPLYSYSTGQPVVAGGGASTYRETNLQRANGLATDQRFVAFRWGVVYKYATFGASNGNADMSELAAALFNVLALRIRMGNTYAAERGPIAPAMLSQPQFTGATAAGPPVVEAISASPSLGLWQELSEPWDIQPGVTILGDLLGDLTQVPPGTVERDGAAIDITVLHDGEWRQVVAG